jgi:hypothetical protein
MASPHQRNAAVSELDTPRRECIRESAPVAQHAEPGGTVASIEVRLEYHPVPLIDLFNECNDCRSLLATEQQGNFALPPDSPSDSLFKGTLSGSLHPRQIPLHGAAGSNRSVNAVAESVGELRVLHVSSPTLTLESYMVMCWHPVAQTRVTDSKYVCPPSSMGQKHLGIWHSSFVIFPSSAAVNRIPVTPRHRSSAATSMVRTIAIPESPHAMGRS